MPEEAAEARPWMVRPAVWLPQEDEVGAGTPHAARVYDALLGGKDNYAVDRMVASQIAELLPVVRDAAIANRGFHERAVAVLARSGIRQFLDVGCGLPTARNTHDVAGREIPGARVLYADHEPVVVAHARALMNGPGRAAFCGKVQEPEIILGSREAREVLRPDEPTGLMLTALLHFVRDEEDPSGIVRRFMDALAPGSCVAISHGSKDNLPPQAAQAGLKIYDQVMEPMVLRTRAEVHALFGDLELLPPWSKTTADLVTADQWLGPDVPLDGNVKVLERRGGEAFWCGVAMKQPERKSGE